MGDMNYSTSKVVQPTSLRTNEKAPQRSSGVTAWLLRADADRWRRRALFYESHRDYFPRLSSGRFVARCHELEATYRGLARKLWEGPSPVRSV